IPSVHDPDLHSFPTRRSSDLDHSKETIELSPFHDLAEHEDVLGKRLLVGSDGEVDVPAQAAGVGHDEVVLGLDGRHVLKHRLTRSEGTRLNSSHVKISYAVFC